MNTRGVWKTENWFGFCVLKIEQLKNLMSIWRLSDKSCMQFTIYIKSVKNNFTCIKWADKVRFKTLPKQSL